MNKINQNIKKYRVEKDLTQDQLAELVFTTKSTISKWESGDITPSIQILKIIAKALEVNVYDLMGEERPISSRVFGWSQKILGYLLLWIHVDISLLFTFASVAFGFIIGGFAILASPIILTVLNSISDTGWNTEHSLYMTLSFIFAPGVSILLIGSGYYLLFGCIKGYNLSLKYYWQVKFRIKCPKFKITKKQLIIVGIVTLVGLITLGAFLGGVASSSDGISSLNYRF